MGGEGGEGVRGFVARGDLVLYGPAGAGVIPGRIAKE
jgi:hypothetical protein